MMFSYYEALGKDRNNLIAKCLLGLQLVKQLAFMLYYFIHILICTQNLFAVKCYSPHEEREVD